MNEQFQRKRALSTSQEIVELNKNPRFDILHEMINEPEEVQRGNEAASLLVDDLCPDCVEVWRLLLQAHETLFPRRRLLQNGPTPGCHGCCFLELMKTDTAIKPADRDLVDSYDLASAGSFNYHSLPNFAAIPSHRTSFSPHQGNSTSYHSFTNRFFEF